MNRRIIIIVGILFLGVASVVGFLMFGKKQSAQIGCTMEAKLCPDGSAVGRSGPQCEFAPCPSAPVTDERVHVFSPLPNTVVSNPVEIRGEARGTWYFEGSFPVSLKDENGKVLGSGIAKAEGEWMTTEFVPFLVKIDFALPTTATGSVVLSKDNPSGLPENDAAVVIPIRFR